MGLYFFVFLKKEYLRDEGLDFTMGCTRRVQNTLPFSEDYIIQ